MGNEEAGQKILIYLGVWRDHMKPEAVEAFQDLAHELMEPSPVRFEPTPKEPGDKVISSLGTVEIQAPREGESLTIAIIGDRPGEGIDIARTPSPEAGQLLGNRLMAGLVRARELLAAGLDEAAQSELPPSPSPPAPEQPLMGSRSWRERSRLPR